MQKFVSNHNLFEVDLPKGWNHNFEDNIYTFYNQDEIEGVLQISAYFHKGEKQFDLKEEELLKEKEKHPTAEVIDLSKYQAIQYGLENTSEKTIHYYWITGHSKTMLLCSLIINAAQDESKLDSSYSKALEILDTLKICNA